MSSDSPLPPPQGYVAEKLSILMGAVRSALRRVGLVVHTVDDSLVPPEDRILEPSLQGSPARPHSPVSDALKVPAGLHSIGHKFEQVLQESAEFKDSRAVHVAQEAMGEDRLHRHITL